MMRQIFYPSWIAYMLYGQQILIIKARHLYAFRDVLPSVYGAGGICPPIRFKKGLNVVLGKEDADNAFLCKENHDLMGPYRMKDEFVNWLKVQYHMDFDGLSFRIALSSFFRIYGKDNTDERRPLRGIPRQDMEKSIALLVALFDRNKDIQV